MKMHRVTVDFSGSNSFPQGRFDADRVEATTKADIAGQIAEDEAEEAQDATRYAQQVRTADDA